MLLLHVAVDVAVDDVATAARADIAAGVACCCCR